MLPNLQPYLFWDKQYFKICKQIKTTQFIKMDEWTSVQNDNFGHLILSMQAPINIILNEFFL